MRIFMVLAASLFPTVALAGPAPSLSCEFTEPFANIQVWPGGMRATHERREPVTNVVTSGTATEPVIQARIAGVATTLTIKATAGSDGMSDREYPLEGRLTGWIVGPRPLYGGCIRFPDGATPREIIGLTRNQNLPIRTLPDASARVLGYQSSGRYVWTIPNSAQRGWVQVAFRVNQRPESGAVKVRLGWVPARNIGAALSE